MTAFLAAAGLLTLVTLALLLRPALPFGARGRPRPTRTTTIALLLAVPLCAGLVWTVLGSREGLESGAAAHGAADAEMLKMVETLAGRLERDPSDTKGWVMLARSYKALGRVRESEAAYDRVGASIDGDAQELAHFADVAASNAGGRFAGKPARLLEKALRADPQNPMALWLAGSAALDAGDAARAVAIWRKLLALLPPDSDDARELSAQIVQAGGSVPAGTRVAAAAAAGSSITGRVELAPGVPADPAASVFIIARAPGQRMPVAVVRTTVAQLPFSFTLDDSSAMSPAARISALKEVEVQARVATSGGPVAKAGDPESATVTVPLGTSGLAVRISRLHTPQ